MAPKGKASEKGSASKDKGKGKATEKEDGGKVKGAQQINVRHILCEKQGKKDLALEKLKGGAKFDEVAKEYSEDKARVGGALGWKKRGDLEPAFADKAFELEASTLASPKYGEAKTQFGYHIIMVEGRK